MNKTADEAIQRCPRCGGPGPQPPDLGALSRADDETIVCSACGQDEAYLDFQARLAAGLLQTKAHDQVALWRLRRAAREVLHPVTGLRRWVRWK